MIEIITHFIFVVCFVVVVVVFTKTMFSFTLIGPWHTRVEKMSNCLVPWRYTTVKSETITSFLLLTQVCCHTALSGRSLCLQRCPTTSVVAGSATTKDMLVRFLGGQLPPWSVELYVRGSLMFCNLVCQQHLQPLCLLHFFKETPLRLYTFDHPLKPAVYDARPRWLGYVQNYALDECSGIFAVLKLLSSQLPFDGMEQKPVTGG